MPCADKIMDEDGIEKAIDKELKEISDLEESADSEDDMVLSSHENEITPDSSEDIMIPSMQDYVSKIQQQSKQLEAELLECDELLYQSDMVSARKTDDELLALAEEHCMDVEDLRQQVLRELEEEDKKEESLLMTTVATNTVNDLFYEAQNSATTLESSGFFVTTNADVKYADLSEDSSDVKTGVIFTENFKTSQSTTELEIVKAITTTDVHNNTNDEESSEKNNGVIAEVFETDYLEKQLMQHVLQMQETRKKVDQERLMEITEMKHRTEQKDQQLEEKRRVKQIEIKKEQQILSDELQQKETVLKEEAELMKIEMEESLEVFEKEINELAKQTAQEKEDWENLIQQEKVRQQKKQHIAAVKIQALYRGHCVRKVHGEDTKAAIQQLRAEKQQQRIDEVQILIDQREEDKRKKKEKEALDKAEEEELKKQQEYEKQKKLAEEKKQKEEEKLRKQEEERQRKETEKRRKEEERKQKEEQKKKKEEDDKKRKEEAKQKREEEKRRKEEEKRKKKEEEEELKRKKQEEKLLRELEEERKIEQEAQTVEPENKSDKEIEKFEEKAKNLENLEMLPDVDMKVTTVEDDSKHISLKKDMKSPRKAKEAVVMILPNGEMDVVGEKFSPTKRGMTDLFIDKVTMANLVELGSNTSDGTLQKPSDDLQVGESTSDEVIKTPRPPSARKIPGLIYDRPNSSKAKVSPNAVNAKESLADLSIRKMISPPSKSVQIVNSDNTRKSIKLQQELSKTKEWGEYLPPPIEQKRLAWIKECKPLSKIFSEHKSKKISPPKKPPRLPASAKNLPDLDEGLVLAIANVQSLKQVTTVELHDLPGCTLKSMSQCVHLKSLCMNNCNLVTTEGLEHCHSLQYADLQNNQLEVLSFRDLSQLIYLDLSKNSIGSLHGLDGCEELRYLNVSNNHITRIGGLDVLKKLHTLVFSHNQLITSKGLSEAPTLQCVDMSHNHLPNIDDLEKLPLLQQLLVSGNSLMQVPKLTNQVLLNDLVLNDNNISFLSGLSQTWLPMVTTLSLNQNSINMLDPMLNLLLLENLDLGNNQVVDLESILPGINATRCLLALNLEGNPLCEDTIYKQEMLRVSPYLRNLDTEVVSPTLTDMKRTEFERLCISQREQILNLKNRYKEALNKSTLMLDTVEIHIKFFQTSHQLATDIRYTHEYGMSMIQPKEIDMNFDVTPHEITESKKLISTTFPNPPSQTTNMKSKFEEALKTGGASTASKDNLALDMKHKFEQTLMKKNLSQRHPASPTPNLMFEQNVTKTMSQANEALSSHEYRLQNSASLNSNTTTTAVLSSPQETKSKFDLALMNNSRNSGTGNGKQTSSVINGGDNRETNGTHKPKRYIIGVDAARVGKLLQSSQSDDVYCLAATKIQAWWRGNFLRKQLEIAYNYARLADLDDDLENFAEVDLGEFDFNMDDFEKELLIPNMPQMPRSHPVIGKPPSHPNKTTVSPPKSNKPINVPPLLNISHQPPENPLQAWRNADSSLSDHNHFLGGRPPLPPLSRMSDGQSCDTNRTKKSERLADEWGFKDTKTAELMYARAKKLKYNAVKKKKLSMLDPKQRLALFRKLEETTRPRPVQVANRKHMPRKEYFQARENEVRKRDFEKNIETQAKGERTFEWVHTQVGNHDLSSSRGQPPPLNMYGSEGNLPRMDPSLVAGGRPQFVNSPISMDLQSVDSVSTFGEPALKPRKLSKGEKLPPIRNASNSAPKERMSFRNPKTTTDVGWGGGRKRNK